MKSAAWTRLLLALGLTCAGFGAGIYGYFSLRPRPEPPVTRVEKLVYVQTPFYTREEINRQIRYLRELGRFEEVLSTYAAIARDRDVAAVILSEALAEEIPVNLLFGVVKQESHFDEKARGSYGEIGLMQLNPRYFGRLIGQHGRSYLWEPVNNVHWGARYLKSLHERLGDWDFAVLRYNGEGKEALQYLLNVQEYERDFDKRFNQTLGLKGPWTLSF
jgi:soluble lytic murein transglycosylase-like protein